MGEKVPSVMSKPSRSKTYAILNSFPVFNLEGAIFTQMALTNGPSLTLCEWGILGQCSEMPTLNSAHQEYDRYFSGI